MTRNDMEFDESQARSLAWSSTKRDVERQSNALMSMGGQLMYPGDDFDDEDAEAPRLKLSLDAPPGLRPEAVLLKMTEVDTGRVIVGRPGLGLLVLMADMKRAGQAEAAIIDELNKRISMPASEQALVNDDPIVVASRPEFCEIMQRIDAARDSHGVPATDQQAVADLIVRFSETFLDHPFSPILPVCLKAIAGMLARENMTATSLSRISLIVEICHEKLKSEMARIERDRANRHKQQRKH